MQVKVGSMVTSYKTSFIVKLVTIDRGFEF